jgi:hypothetical protein
VKPARGIVKEVVLGVGQEAELQQRLVKTGGRLIRDVRYYWLLLAESHLTRLFGSILH